MNLVGMRFGFLTVVEKTERKNDRWKCLCDCGKYTFADAWDLTCGCKKSCGCMQHRRGAKKYGEAYVKSPELYKVWSSMKQRCENPNRKRYEIYGGRGISVCDEWQNPNEFIKWALSNGYQQGLQIDRIDNERGYSPNNCRWVTVKENSRNRRSNVLLTVNGITKTAIEWSEDKGVNQFTLYSWVREKGKTYAEKRLSEIV